MKSESGVPVLYSNRQHQGKNPQTGTNTQAGRESRLFLRKTDPAFLLAMSARIQPAPESRNLPGTEQELMPVMATMFVPIHNS